MTPKGRAVSRHLSREGRVGRNSVAFSGRIGSRALKPGKYTATLTAIDAAGNRSRAARATLTVVRR